MTFLISFVGLVLILQLRIMELRGERCSYSDAYFACMIINYCLNVKVCLPTLSLNTLMIIKPMVISLSYYLWFVLSIFILRINGFKFKFCNCRRFK